ncbi:MAG: ABC transporter permease [Lachnospiraceae bacterium]|nr:ABC transporter permease [Lachnospiraceae bacterium]
MQKILRKRVVRDLKENFLRYLALGLLIILGMYLVVSIIGAADTIIDGTRQMAEQNQCEDGQFGTFVPLSNQEKEEITNQGITLEEMFYLDFSMEDDSTLRVFSNRQEINLIALEEGKLAEKENEVVLEKRYAEEHSYKVGDSITIADKEYKITGIGTTPDYEAPYKEFSDSSVDSSQFGVAFLTEDDYERLKSTEKSEKTESYYYAYRLNGKMTDEELKEQIKEFEFSAEEIEDVYFQEYWDRTGGKKEELQEGITELNDGGEELRNGLSELTEHNQELTDAAEQLLAVYPQGTQAGQAANNFVKSLKEYADGVEKVADGSKELSEGINELDEQTNELMDEYFEIELSNLTMFLKAEDNLRIGAAGDDQIINKLGGLIAGVVVMILFTYVISVFVIHGIEKESSVIGALYALGVKRKDLIWHYLQLPVIVTVLAGLVGTGIAFSSIGIPVQMQDCYDYFSISKLQVRYPAYLMVYSVIMPPVVALLVNYFVIRKSLSKTVLSLLKEEKKESKISNVDLGNMGFIRRFQIRQMLREVRTGFTVIFGMFISLLILMLGLDCYVMCSHIKTAAETDTKFEYMYTYKYPEEQVLEGGEEAFAKTLKREAYGYNLDVTLLGIRKENPYFEVKTEKGENKVVVTSSVAEKYKLGVGDDIVLKDEEEGRNYAFTITDVVEYSTGFYVFMDIESMRELFEEADDYYNVVFSDKELDIPAGRLYSTTNREELVQSSGIFVDMMMSMIIMMTSVAILIFCVVMYLMMKVMVDRSAFGISLVKIFGYRPGEIRKLYLNGNFYTILVGAAVSVPLSKKVMDLLYPYMVANVACGMNLDFGWKLYVAIFAAIIVVYLIINQLLVYRINKIVPAEVLKNRE